MMIIEIDEAIIHFNNLRNLGFMVMEVVDKKRAGISGS
jgi:hypothetical protein